MVALVVGILLVLFTVFASIPSSLHGLGWGEWIVVFFKGCAPVLAALVGLIAIFIGIADLKDKKEAKREEEAARASGTKID